MYTTFVSYLKTVSPTCFHIILHHNADPDAICAAEIYKFLITQISDSHEVRIYSDDINTTATRIMDQFAIKVNQDLPELHQEKGNVVLTVDTANISQLGKYADWLESQNLDLLVVDHHETSEMAKDAVASIVITDTASTCVIADRTLKEANVEPNADIATLILSGHMYDSRRMLYGSTAEVFARFSYLLKIGGDFELANELLQNDMNHGEKIARLKASQRLRYHTIGEIIVVTSRVGAFEASAARSFIGAGADISFILAPKNSELRGSARADARLINIGEVMSQLAEEFGGTGGGHAAAAGMNINPKPDKKTEKQIFNRFVKIVKEKLENN